MSIASLIFINEDLHRLIHDVISAHPLVIFLKIPIRKFRIRKVKVHQHLLGGDVGVSYVFFLAESNVGFVNGGDEQRQKVIVRHVVFGIKGRVDVIFTESVCNLCCR